MFEKIYKYRFELFLFSQVAVLFGSLLVPHSIFDEFLDPILFLVNLLVGVVLLSNKRKLMWFCIAMLGVSFVVFLISISGVKESSTLGFIRMTGYFLFYLVVTFEIIKQVWKANEINNNVIFGLISGYISLGLLGFFLCLSIEFAFPGSFQGGLLDNAKGTDSLAEQLMYFSFITLLTIGYGDILPVTSLAQKAAIVIGLSGQFYLVIITAVVVGKFIQQK